MTIARTVGATLVALTIAGLLAYASMANLSAKPTCAYTYKLAAPTCTGR